MPTYVAEYQGLPLDLSQGARGPREQARAWVAQEVPGWDFEAAKNTTEAMAEGRFGIEGAVLPAGFVRKLTRASGETLRALVKLANLLREDPDLPLFAGLRVRLNGVEVMLVKEVHQHRLSELGSAAERRRLGPKGLRDQLEARQPDRVRLYQPHTGISILERAAQP